MQSRMIRLPLLGGLVAGIAASLCCLGPLVLLTLGAGGAWVGKLTALEPWRPYFLAVALLALTVAWWKIYIQPSRQACEPGSVCFRPAVKRSYRAGFWFVAALVALSLSSPYLAPFFY